MTTLPDLSPLLLADPGPSAEPGGTKLSEYVPASLGPFRCDQCVWYPQAMRCGHPKVVADAQVDKDAFGLAVVDAAGCCRYQRKRETQTIDLSDVLLAHDIKKRIVFQSIPIAIENPKGSVRSGTNADGTEWHIKMTADYGYIERVPGMDRDELDVFVGEHMGADTAFIVRTVNVGRQTPDEEKAMLGFASEAEAKKAFLKNYDSPAHFGSIQSMPMPAFKEWLALRGAKLRSPAVIAVDFDGVFAKREEPFRPDSAGAPIEKGFKIFKRLQAIGHEPYILTARTDTNFVVGWLRYHGLSIGYDEVTNQKRPATAAVIDDRAVETEDSDLETILANVQKKIALSDSQGRRTAHSEFWDGPVKPDETHVDFRSAQSAMEHHADRIGKVLSGPLRAKLIRSIASQAMYQLRAGRSPHELSFRAEPEIDAKLRPAVERAYLISRKQARAETDRLLRSRQALMLQDTPDAKAAKSIGQLTLQATAKYVNRYADAARHLAADEGADALAEGEDLFVTALHRLADSGTDLIGDQLSRETARMARTDEFQADPRLQDSVWRRSSVLEAGRTCDPCWQADGTEIDADEADSLSDICDGGLSCMCLPYLSSDSI